MIGQVVAWQILLCALVAGLFAMHGLQPTPGPAEMPVVWTMRVVQDGMPSYAPGASDAHDRQMPAHDGHGGGEVCLGLLLMVALTFLVARALGTSRGLEPRVLGRLVPRATSAPLARGPTLTQLCVLRR
ncbi:hypothetical protein Sme01_33980 [Sphaerisporangium melleum]|uniref:Uncharacterized protein n=1 Tax=Sphaerisporangium melleum TaxID=321316 RepID=A0A917VGE2_9ACTN|nr:hypothetical protein GCM10007964_16660 [Sphaerisporangium melleum]GII70922.1 hypothetical protein Sme01_33980 [Sphaerisporangium melleum]